MKHVASPFFRWRTKDYLDQPLHMFGGYGSVVFTSLFSTNTWSFLFFSVLTMIAFGYREYTQHRETEVIFDMDLFFVFIGVVIANVVVNLL